MRRAALKLTAVGTISVAAFVAYHANDAAAHWDDIAEVEVDPGSIFDGVRSHRASGGGSSGASSADDGGVSVVSRDCFEVVVPRRDFPGGDAAGFSREAALVEFTRAFFTAPLFTVERSLIAASTLSFPPPSVEEDMFRVGRKLGIWEVAVHQPHGISMHWWRGTTNFSVRRGPTAGHFTVRFGSTLEGVAAPPAPIAAAHELYSKLLLSQAVANLERRAAVASRIDDQDDSAQR